MKELKKLLSLCNNSVTIQINLHRDYYESVTDHIGPDDIGDIDAEILSKMVNTDTIVRIQVYPKTAIGFYVIYHYDIELAIQEALNALK